MRGPLRWHPPPLDEFQQSVVDHPGGPLLVLAGPGTGKTTTLVEAIVDRIERRGADPASVLALTFSRKAAEQLRDRVTARLGRTMATTLSSTFHSFAYGLVRRYSTADLYAAPLRLLSAPGAGRRSCRSFSPATATRRCGRRRWTRRSPPAGSRARCRRCWPGPVRKGSTRSTSRSSGTPPGLPSSAPRPCSCSSTR